MSPDSALFLLRCTAEERKWEIGETGRGEVGWGTISEGETDRQAGRGVGG